MNIEKLEIGKTFKNYKIMCEELGVPIKTGKAKQLQMNDIHRYCSTVKSGHSIIVEEVFKTPLPKLDGRGRKSIYSQLLQVLFTDYFLNLENSNLTITRNSLLKNMNMVNSKYQESSYNMDLLAKELEIIPETVYDFYTSTRGSFKYMIESTLDSLRDKSLIIYEKVLIVSKRSEGYHGIASIEEKESILEAEKRALGLLGYDNIGQVIASRRWREFKHRVHEKLEDIEYYYSSYSITINRKYIESDHNKMLSKLIEDIDRENKKDELNELICNRLIENARNRKKNTKSDSRLYESRNIPTYEKDNKLLVDYLIKIENIN